MKLKRIERGYTLYMTKHEHSMLMRVISHFDIDKEWPHMTSGERRSWSRRIRGGSFLRVDSDARKNKYD